MYYLRSIGSIFLVSIAISAFAQTGTGLTGKYDDTETFGTLKTTRTEASIDFNFDRAIPSGKGIAVAMTCSVACSGQIEAAYPARVMQVMLNAHLNRHDMVKRKGPTISLTAQVVRFPCSGGSFTLSAYRPLGC